MTILKLAGLDAAMANLGIAIAEYDIEAATVQVTHLRLIQTERQVGKLKVVRQSSDDLRRARELFKGTLLILREHKVQMICAEVPSGGENARAAFGFGMVTGLLGALPLPVIEVSPKEVKVASVGHGQATKDEMIAWAYGRWPDAAGWLRQQRDGAKFKKGDLMNANEHLADACAVIAAGVETVQFAQGLAMSGMARAAA